MTDIVLIHQEELLERVLDWLFEGRFREAQQEVAEALYLSEKGIAELEDHLRKIKETYPFVAGGGDVPGVGRPLDLTHEEFVDKCLSLLRNRMCPDCRADEEMANAWLLTIRNALCPPGNGPKEREITND